MRSQLQATLTDYMRPTYENLLGGPDLWPTALEHHATRTHGEFRQPRSNGNTLDLCCQGNMKQPQNRHFVQMPLGVALGRTEYINSHMGPISANRDTYHRTNETSACTEAQIVGTSVV